MPDYSHLLDLNSVHWIEGRLRPTQCPLCHKPGRWRRGGPEFESEMRCPTCNHVWEPDRVEDDLKLHADHLRGQFGDGI